MYTVCKSCLTHVEASEKSCPFCDASLEGPPPQRRPGVARVSGKSSMIAAALGVTLSLNIACNKLAPEPQPTLYGGPPIEEVPVADEPTPPRPDMGGDAGETFDMSAASGDMSQEQGAAKPTNEKVIRVDTPAASIYGGPPVDIYGAPPVDDDELKPTRDPSEEEEDSSSTKKPKPKKIEAPPDVMVPHYGVPPM